MHIYNIIIEVECTSPILTPREIEIIIFDPSALRQIKVSTLPLLNHHTWWLSNHSSLRDLEASYTRNLVRLLVVVMMARGIAGSLHLVCSLSWHGRAVLSGALRSGNAVSVALSSQSINDRNALAFEPTHLAEETAKRDFGVKTLQPNAY